jgi:hypothetical protein
VIAPAARATGTARINGPDVTTLPTLTIPPRRFGLTHLSPQARKESGQRPV